MGKPCDGIFIVGCPRSGTTLLQSMLAVHPAILSFPESKFFLYLVSLPEYRSKRYAMGLVAPRLRPMLNQFLAEIGHPELRRRLPKFPLIRLYTRYFVTILNELAHAQGKQIWLEKTPDHLRYIKYIETFVPSTKIIHIVRNGTDVVASMFELVKRHPERWGRYLKNLDDCIERWTEDIEISRRCVGQPDHVVVRYEELVSNPYAVLTHLCECIGIQFDERMMREYALAAKPLIRDRETWKAAVEGELKNANSQKFYTVLDELQRQYVLDQISHVDLEWATLASSNTANSN
ncbi:MAG: sulfotransferase family protein [Elainellaceae cyanobacterium]